MFKLLGEDIATRCGIIGYGVVGQAIGSRLVKNNVNAWVFDTKTQPQVDPVLVNKTKAIFVCVNTPALKGKYDVTNMNKVFESLIMYGYKGLVILISTMGINEYKQLKYKHKDAKFNVMVCPEFLTEKNAASDFYNQTDVTYGPWINKAVDTTFQHALRACKKTGVRFFRKTVEECLLIKTGKNLTLFLKLVAANLVYSEAQYHGLSAKAAQEVINEIYLDERLESYKAYHTVGCHEGTLGVAGTCLPKDVEGKTHSTTIPALNKVFTALTELNIYFRSRKLTK